MEPTPSTTSFAIPVAIIAGFALIASAIYFSGTGSQPPNTVQVQSPATTTVATGSIRPVDGTDYIYGNPNAPILLVEYSDYDCPFCKQYHDILRQLMDEYGVTGQVGWVYRQFPLARLHPNAPKLSEAALCVGDLGGSKAFWDFTNSVFGGRSETEFTNMTRIVDYATEAGVDRGAFEGCVASGKFTAQVQAEITNAFEAGVRGTPHTFIIAGNEQVSMEGAQSYTVLKALIENLTQQLAGTFDPNAPANQVTPEL